MKILKIFFFLFFLFSFSFVNAESIPVEKIFKDIDKNYPYYEELQSLYDRWIISPDKDWKFNPNEKLTRDEFVWIVSEISCKDCIQPNVDFSFVQKYSNTKTFFDISKNDKYFYCVAEAVDSGQVTWYQDWTVCQNWVSRTGEKPFCPENHIILEEALAIILRAWNLLTISEAEAMRKEISSWKVFPNVWNISPKLSDGNVYSFYPDFKKAFDYTFTDYNKDWNERKIKLLDFSKNINPKQFVTREDFLKIAYIALKNNSCQNIKQNLFWLQIEILDKTCNPEKQNCRFTDFPDWEKIFDFRWKISKLDDNWFTYNWRFYNYETGEDSIESWKYVDNHNFWKPWKYRVYLTAKSNDWQTSEVYNDITLFDNNSNDKNKSWLTSYIITDKTTAKVWEPIKFTWVTNKGTDVTYSWDFWDWNNSYWKTTTHNFPANWTYTITLTSTDKDWNSSTSTVTIKISNTPWYEWKFKDSDWDWIPDEYDKEINTPKDKKDYVCRNDHIQAGMYGCTEDDLWVYNPAIEKDENDSRDTDGDWVPDKRDYCPNIKWDKKNFWCPIFEQTCKTDSNCQNWFFCDDWYCRVKKYSLNCGYSWGHIITWNVEKCNSCPCEYEVDFRAKLRACDIIFPAITSPDKKDIYSKGKYYQIKK